MSKEIVFFILFYGERDLLFILILSLGDEEFIILACDGLWDTVEPFDAVQLVRKCMEEGNRDSAAGKLVDLAIEQRSMDNISILVVFFDFNGPVIFSADNNTNSEEVSVEKKQEEKDIVQNHVSEDPIAKGQLSDEKIETQQKPADEKPAVSTTEESLVERTSSSNENT